MMAAHTKKVINVKEPIPLEDAWCIWFDRYIGRGYTAQEYSDAIKQVCCFNTVQNFWRWFNNLPTAGELEVSCTYHLMKEGIRPLWEDPRNVRGGNFTAKIPIEGVDDVWMNLCLLAIGGQFDLFLSEFGDEICGISIGMRKTDASIYIWNASAKAFDMKRMISYLESSFSSKKRWGNPQLLNSIRETGVYKVHQNLDNFKNETKIVTETEKIPKENKKEGQPVDWKSRGDHKTANEWHSHEPSKVPIYDKPPRKQMGKREIRIVIPINTVDKK